MVKNTLLNALVAVDAFSVFRFINRSKVPILMYHRFSDSEEFGKISRSTLEAHLKYLRRHYRIISLTEAVAHLKEARPLPKRTAVLTIDDGYRDFYDVAFPVLKKFDIPATFYVVTGFLNGECWIWTDKARYLLSRTAHERFSFTVGEKQFDERLGDANSRLILAGRVNSELKKIPDAEKELVLADLARELAVEITDTPPAELGAINWDQAREMSTAGIEIGSHTVNHPILTNVEEETLTDELVRSRNDIENELQLNRVHFCYPNGNVSTRERDAVQAAGYESAVTTEIRLCGKGENGFLLPRVDTEPQLVRLIQATSGFDSFKSNYR